MANPDPQYSNSIILLALQQVGYGKSIMKAMGCFMIPMVIIPIFWPILLVVYFSFKHSRRALDHYVASACRYWNIDPDRDLVL